MKRSRLVLVAIAIAIAAVAALCIPLWKNEGPRWRIVVTKKVYFEEKRIPHSRQGLSYGWRTVKSHGEVPHGRGVVFNKGWKHKEYDYHNGLAVRVTIWKHGMVQMQYREVDEHARSIERQYKRSPSWWWDKTDYARPPEYGVQTLKRDRQIFMQRRYENGRFVEARTEPPMWMYSTNDVVDLWSRNAVREWCEDSDRFLKRATFPGAEESIPWWW